MTRTFVALFMFLSLVSCGKGGGGNSSSAIPSEVDFSDEVSTISNTPAPTLAQTFDIEASLSNFTASQEAKVYEAIERIKKVVASDEFKKKVINHTYKGKKRFVDNGGLTNTQIYNKILAASEILTPGKNNTMDLILTTYYTNENVIGYTMKNIKTIYMNRRYLANFEPHQVASNLFHEWLHKLGFGHDVKATASRPYSVPYAIGYIVKDLAKKM